MSLVKLKCDYCENEFERRKAEYNRSQKLGRKNYCSSKCSGKVNNNHLEKWKKEPFPHAKRGSCLDEYSSFRFFLRMIKNRKRDRNIEYNISIEYLKTIWEIQKGICPYTGWEMELPEGVSRYPKLSPKRASIDRIDPNKGYIEGNIEFICFIANMAKYKFSKKEVIEFCKAVVNYE